MKLISIHLAVLVAFQVQAADLAERVIAISDGDPVPFRNDPKAIAREFGLDVDLLFVEAREQPD